ncbi:putative protein NDR1 [Helianthus annuus]|nr:hypothetical protein HanIR_Chr11g0508491 [Helianthus annuus]KAJ0733268.1 putative protein NDR1 [Helianthus annuus]KAJ0873670.1 hypothetical protein HanPSC8_Chr11g0455161 [Helianthus annuus]
MATPHHQIHIQTTPNDHLNHGSLTDGSRPHHNTKYNAHHVQDSLTTRVTKLICAVFLSILFTVGLVTFILWLGLRPHRPRFHVQQFSFPSLAEPNGFSTAQLTFNVTARNPNIEIGIYYDTVENFIKKLVLIVAYYNEEQEAYLYTKQKTIHGNILNG